AAVVADAYVAHLRDVRDGAFDVPPAAVDVAGVLTDPATRESARAAAAEVAALNGAVFVGGVDARCAGQAIEIELRHAERIHRALVEAEACSPR
ncbi:MAG TPA: hypothetical protein VJP45_03325, partial [Candidatus Limnocylindria bacterium]|nr:hypothetical protein [Candidatus Limnocylindria bacterium]